MIPLVFIFTLFGQSLLSMVCFVAQHVTVCLNSWNLRSSAQICGDRLSHLRLTLFG